MISLITWQHLNVYSYKLKNNVCVISIFYLYEAKKKKQKKNWLVKIYCGSWSKKLTSGPVHMRSFLWWMRLLRIRSTGLATRLIRVSRSSFHTLLIWRNPTFLWSQHGCDSPSPHGYDGRIIDRLGRTLRRQTSARCLDRRVPLLAHTLPGAQRRLPGTDSLSPPSQRVSCDCQDGQHGGGILHKSPRGFTVAHPEQACTQSSPLVSEQVPLPESSLRSRSFEPGGRFSIEAETQAGGMDAEPSVSSPDLGSIRQSGSGPLCITRVVPIPRYLWA